MITVTVTIAGREKQVKIAEGKTIEDLLLKLDLFPDAYIALKAEKPTPLTHVLVDGEKLRLLKVASGG